MPIKPYIPISPPLLPLRRISALIIEEDLSDIDSPDASWFMPSKTYETITISQKELGPKPVFTFPQFNGQEDSSSSEVTTAADTSRRPSISLARLQTRGLDDADIKLPNYNYQFCSSIPTTQQRKRRPSSDVFFHSPLQKSRTYSDNDTSSCSSSSHSPRSGGRFSGFDSPILYPESDCGCNCDCGDKDYPIGDVFDDDDDEYCGDEEEGDEVVDECHISKSASSEPIEVPKSPNSSHSSHRRRRGCFVEDDVMDTSTLNVDDECAIVEDEEDDDDDEGLMMKDVKMDEDESVSYKGTLEDWIHFAYAPTTSFETALISEVVRRRKSDEHFADLKSQNDGGLSSEKQLENAQFSEAHRRGQWMRNMVRWYPQECTGGHMLPTVAVA